MTKKTLKENTSVNTLPTTDKKLQAAARTALKEFLAIAKVFEIDRETAQRTAVAVILKNYGVDYSEFLDLHKVKQTPRNEMLFVKSNLSPTELGAVLALSAVETNKLLAELGLQTRAEEGWKVTKEGEIYAVQQTWRKSESSGAYYRWKREVLAVIKASMKGTF